MTAGRPVKSRIRENIIEILYHLGEGYAYGIYKTYLSIFPAVSRASIYYHLNKGVDLKEFLVKSVRREKGNYSWGSEAEKVYYSLGTAAHPRMNPAVKRHFDSKK